jgi:hypothetical protein
MKSLQLQICVVAHNEQDHIIGCLESIEKSAQHAQVNEYCVHIINNGSSDNTQQLSDHFCQDKKHWYAHEVSKGDKSNAWNLGVYQYATADVLTVYIDGDCKISLGTLKAFIDAHSNRPNAYIYAAIPITQGNTTEQTIKNTLAGTALSGNLFALSEVFIKTVREKSFKLPVGLIGDDSLLAWVSSHNFKLSNGVIPGFLIGIENAQFEYHRLTPTSWSNIKLYFRRLQRYSLRHIQQNCIRSFLDENNNFELLPDNIESLYSRVDEKYIRNNSLLNKYFDKRAYIQVTELMGHK